MKEIEFGAHIKSPTKIRNFFKAKKIKKSIIKIEREIWKKRGGRFFVKITKQQKNRINSYIFSIKEDLLIKGVKAGMKVAEEIDLSVSKKQLLALKTLIRQMGLKKTNVFKKTREVYFYKNTEVAIDKYADGYYLETEGKSEKQIKKVVAELFFGSQR